eukprot:scaffold1954_cov268-Pinguiococcus_pyrenoidosus.AAC.105
MAAQREADSRAVVGSQNNAGHHASTGSDARSDEIASLQMRMSDVLQELQVSRGVGNQAEQQDLRSALRSGPPNRMHEAGDEEAAVDNEPAGEAHAGLLAALDAVMDALPEAFQGEDMDYRMLQDQKDSLVADLRDPRSA